MEVSGLMSTPQKPLSKPLWWGMFALATVALSLCFKAFKVFTLAPTLLNGLMWLLAIAVMVLATGVLAYDSYVEEKGRGRVQNQIRLFEWLIEKRFLQKSGETP